MNVARFREHSMRARKKLLRSCSNPRPDSCLGKKGRYLQALHAADYGNYTALIQLIGQAVEMGLDFYLDACAAVPDEQYQPLADLALTHGYDINYLGLLARQGKLEGIWRGKLPGAAILNRVA